MQNEVFNRRLFQRKDGARTRLNQLARADQPSGILASSQPLIDEAMKSVRRPETSAIPMDVAKGMSAGRADGMPMAPAPMPMPMAPPPAPMPMAPPPQQMAQSPQPQPQPNLNPMRPGVRTMQEGGETTPMGPLESGEEAIARNMSDIDISDLAGTVLQAIGIIDDPDIKPKPTLQGLVAVAGGDPDVKDIKGAAAKVAKEFKLSKINTKDSIPKIVKQIRGDLGKMAESTEFFGMAADKDPRAASAFGRAMGKAQKTQMGLEADKQKDILDFNQAMKVAAYKAANTAASSPYRKGIRPTDARLSAEAEARKVDDFEVPEGMSKEEYVQAIGERAYQIAAGNQSSTEGSSGSGAPVTNEEFIALAKDRLERFPQQEEKIRQMLVERGLPAESV